MPWKDKELLSPRSELVTLAVGLAVVAIGYRFLVAGHLEQTAALFIGLPTILSILLILTPPAKSHIGMLLKGTTIALLMSGIVLGEGFICILMAAPLFYLVAIVVGMFMEWRRKADERERYKKLEVLLFLPLFLMSLEGTHPSLSFPRQESVTVTRTVAASPEAVTRKLSQQPKFDKPLPFYLGLGFPRPIATQGRGLAPGSPRLIRFGGGEGLPGDLVMQVAESQPGRVRFRTLSDSSHIAHWLDWQSAEITWRQSAPGQVEISLTLRYRRSLDPAWYFGPWERYAVSLAAGYVIDTLATP